MCAVRYSRLGLAISSLSAIWRISTVVCRRAATPSKANAIHSRRVTPSHSEVIAREISLFEELSVTLEELNSGVFTFQLLGPQSLEVLRPHQYH